MKIETVDIAYAGLCSESAVKKAKQRGKLETLEDVVCFVLASRLKRKGMDFLDGLAGELEVEPELHYVKDETHSEGEW